MKISEILSLLREKEVEVFIQLGNDAYTFPVDEQHSTWIVVIPKGLPSTLQNIIAHELGHIYLATIGYEIFGVNILQKNADLFEGDDREAVAILFNVVADIAVELVMRSWGYKTAPMSFDGILSVDTEREAGAIMIGYILGFLDDASFEYFYPEGTWQYKLVHDIKAVFDSGAPIEEKLDKFIEVINELLPFEVDRMGNIK